MKQLAQNIQKMFVLFIDLFLFLFLFYNKPISLTQCGKAIHGAERPNLLEYLFEFDEIILEELHILLRL